MKKYYNENAQNEWSRLESHPFEFIFTAYMMDKYIKRGDSILDIGGGPGRYSIYYANKDCDVTLIDLSEENIKLAGEKAKENNVSFHMFTSNCLDIDKLNLSLFDHVFLMGPLYHLTNKEERKKAINLALERLKPGGLFYCSFILNFAGIIYDLKNSPGYLVKDLKNPYTHQLLNSIAAGTEYTGPAFTSSCFISQRQIEPFMKEFKLEKIHLFGQEGILALNEKQVLDCPQEELNLWIETAKQFLEIPEFLAFSEHAMYIGRKKQI